MAKETEELQKQYDNVVAKYKGSVLWMKAPNGQPTNLTEEQWVLVRTPYFKSWFGDWESCVVKNLLGKIQAIRTMDVNDVPEVFKRIRDKGSKANKERLDWASSVVKKGIIPSPVGNVIISKNTIRASLSPVHGMNRYSASLYPILDQLIENSVFAENTTKANEVRPLLISKFQRPSGEIGYVGILLRENKEGNFYYVHQIVQKKDGQGHSQNENQPETASSLKSLVLKHISVNDSDIAKKVDKNREPLIPNCLSYKQLYPKQN